MPQSRVQVRRSGSRRIAERESLTAAGCIVMQVRWDRDREARTGVPEVVYGPGKTSATFRGILCGTSELRIASRLSDEQMEVLRDLATIHLEARMAVRN